MISANHPQPPRTREPEVFVVSSDSQYAESILSQCRDVPKKYTVYDSIKGLMSALSKREKVNLAFAVIVEESGDSVDTPALRVCKLNFPQLYYIVMLEECRQQSNVRFQSLGVQSLLLPPFSEVSLKREIATALPNIPQFKRHPDLMSRGSVRLDFLIPSDLSYVLGVNHLISMLLKEFSFPASECRINIPLACDEALTNAIIHGNNSDPEKKVSIQIYISSSRIKLRIKDQGEGFDVDEVQNPTEGANVMRSSGRGVFLMKSIMDTVEYKDGGRVLELEKANSELGERGDRNNAKRNHVAG
ncbi:MAG: ATP-binding protein [Candidatus Latescibacterota bacterium]|nr:MAG: ATP-binding protein [Candidatus Latescibacterota bacterium]